ncbi:MAG: hypothetical protein ACXVC1_05145 [Tumebacillaceae bacterium]
MSGAFDALGSVKEVLVMHLLRQQIEADLAFLRTAPLRLTTSYDAWLSQIHGKLLTSIGERKRELRQRGIRVVKQQKNSLDFEIAYLERGYQVQHCFLLANLHAEAQVLLMQYLSETS